MVEQVRKLSFAAHALLDAGLSSNVAAGMLELAAGRVDDNAMKAHLMAVVSALRDGTFDRVRPGGAALTQRDYRNPASGHEIDCACSDCANATPEQIRAVIREREQEQANPEYECIRCHCTVATEERRNAETFVCDECLEAAE